MRKQKQHKHTEFRRLLRLVIIISLPISAVLLARAYFMNQPAPPAVNTPQVAGKSVPGLTPLVDIAPTNLIQTSVWGEAITNSSMLPASDGLWLEITTSEFRYLGELKPDGFHLFEQIPADAQNIHLYSDSSLIYTLDSSKRNLSSLMSIIKSQSTTLFSADSGQNIDSVYFEPQTKSFYMALDKDQAIKIVNRKPGKDPVEIFTTDQFNKLEILQVSVSDNTLVFKSDVGNCYKLDMNQKVYVVITCSVVEAEKLPDDTPDFFPYQLLEVHHFKDGKLVLLAYDTNLNQVLLEYFEGDESVWLPVQINECTLACSYKFL